MDKVFIYLDKDPNVQFVQSSVFFVLQTKTNAIWFGIGFEKTKPFVFGIVWLSKNKPFIFGLVLILKK